MIRIRLLAALTLVSLLHSGADLPPVHVAARVINAMTLAPISDAILTIGATALRTDAEGRFALDATEGATIHVRAAGYVRSDVPVKSLREPDAEICLTPFRPKALYLTVYGIGDSRLRTDALHLLETTELNALVIDVKGDRGIVPYRSEVSLTAAVGAQRVITIGDLHGLVKDLRDRGVYTIARLVVFKDTLLAEGRPDLAIRRRDGSIYRDGEGLAWTNPYSRDVWTYNIQIALEAARAGFDEIQFDYVRLPDATGLVYEQPWTEQGRETAIEGFLTEARTALMPFNVFLAADVFGYVCWNPDDTRIGQKLEHLTGIVDYVSPMLYPSSFQFGIPGYRNPVEHPYQIIRLSLEQAIKRAGVAPFRFRPWLQAFPDYAFGGRPFTADDVRAQIQAAEDVGSDGWLIWNPHNEYSTRDFTPRK